MKGRKWLIILDTTKKIPFENNKFKLQIREKSLTKLMAGT